MTIETLREHEAEVLQTYEDDYRRVNLERLALRYVVKGPVLDTRCFSGTLPVELATRGFEVVGLDGYSGAVDKANALARSRGLEQPVVQLWDLTGLVERVGEKRFETVLCLDLLSHVRDDRETMAEISQTLVDGGRLIVMAPAYPMLHGKRDDALGHLRRYSRSGLRALLEHTGFQVESIRPWNFAALPFYFFAEKLLRKGVSQGVRTLDSRVFGPLPKQILNWWYRFAENRLILPWGLSFFVIAHKKHPLRGRPE